jgi:toxin HigB-1
VIASFADEGTEDVFHGRDTRRARQSCPPNIRRVARRKLDQLNQAATLEDLRVPPGNRLEPLHGDREGQHSVRVNDQYRVCFRWTGVDAENAEITDYH